MSARGFTLIELMIALVILAFISIGTATAIRSSAAFKNKTQHDLDQHAALQSALGTVERDVLLAFHYHDFFYDIDKSSWEQRRQAAEAQHQPFAEAEPKVPVEVSFFEGEKDKLALTTLSNVIVRPDQHESDQLKVAYEVRGCHSPFHPDRSMQCLFRRTNPIMDGKVPFTDGEEVAILENVTDFKLRYFGDGKDEWVDAWKSTDPGDIIVKDKFPLAVEITLATDVDKKKMKLTTVEQIRMPGNNAVSSPSSTTGGPVGPPQQPPPPAR